MRCSILGVKFCKTTLNSPGGLCKVNCYIRKLYIFPIFSVNFIYLCVLCVVGWFIQERATDLLFLECFIFKIICLFIRFIWIKVRKWILYIQENGFLRNFQNKQFCNKIPEQPWLSCFQGYKMDFRRWVLSFSLKKSQDSLVLIEYTNVPLWKIFFLMTGFSLWSGLDLACTYT